jgi:hypothetical protein
MRPVRTEVGVMTEGRRGLRVVYLEYILVVSTTVHPYRMVQSITSAVRSFLLHET